MILAIKTDTAVLELALINAGDLTIQHERKRELGRLMARNILTEIEILLTEAAKQWSNLSGIILFTGPGSFTGLRIGATVANTIAYSENIPVVGANGAQWREEGAGRLKNSENDKMVMPEYGKPANITKPRK